ncbi:MAG: hypothetical protein LUM44_09970 [Pyrinomonadaceae bacterium]|nr:hypothetical protein [Pyrinomonadaceae bacterium]
MKNEEHEINEGMLYAESLFGHKSRKGLVKLSYGITFEIQLLPSDARAFALSILEAAEAAETDELIWQFFTNEIGIIEDDVKTGMLISMRNLREEIRRKEEK